MTNKPNAYNITPEHFARARADIARRRAQLDAELARVDADESVTAQIAKRYPEAAVEEAEGASKPPQAKGQKTKRPNTGRPYKPAEKRRIVNAERGELEALAEALGREYPGVLKQHEVLLKQRKPSRKTDMPTPAEADNQTTNSPRAAEADDETRCPDRLMGIYTGAMPRDIEKEEEPMEQPTPPGRGYPVQEPQGLREFRRPTEAELTEAERIAEQRSKAGTPMPVPVFDSYETQKDQPPPTTAARELAEFDARRQRMPRAKPGIPVMGLTNDGPGKDRFLDPVAFASRRPD